MRKYLPTNFDLVDYDRDLLKKQLDLETVQVVLNKEESVGLDQLLEGGHNTTTYVRSVSRFTNEEGTFMRLKMDLQKIGQEYGVSEDDINDIFFEVSCSKTKLIEHLKG